MSVLSWWPIHKLRELEESLSRVTCDIGRQTARRQQLYREVQLHHNIWHESFYTTKQDQHLSTYHQSHTKHVFAAVVNKNQMQ